MPSSRESHHRRVGAAQCGAGQPPKQALAEDGEDSPEAHLLRHCGQDLRTSASKLSLGTRWVFSADPDPPLYCGGVASPTQWTQV